MTTRKLHTLRIKPRDLFPSTLYLGQTVIKFMVGKRGRSVKVEHSGKRKPRFRKREA